MIVKVATFSVRKYSIYGIDTCIYVCKYTLNSYLKCIFYIYALSGAGMTFDPACSHYTGPWLTVSSSGRNYTTPIVNGSNLAGDNFFLKQAKGAEVMVMNGTGAYQSRRLLDWGHTAAGGLWWLLDRPFAAAPGAESFLEITCTHTHIIFERDRHEDVGAFQLCVLILRNTSGTSRFEFEF
jgi:hypothetical protein